jgi:hypothetical protein
MQYNQKTKQNKTKRRTKFTNISSINHTQSNTSHTKTTLKSQTGHNTPHAIHSTSNIKKHIQTITKPRNNIHQHVTHKHTFYTNTNSPVVALTSPAPVVDTLDERSPSLGKPLFDDAVPENIDVRSLTPTEFPNALVEPTTPTPPALTLSLNLDETTPPEI